jgi:hypothetical protein
MHTETLNTSFGQLKRNYSRILYESCICIGVINTFNPCGVIVLRGISRQLS